ncbi:unnamed protein product [Calicophoron daubneyi]|uniref:RNA exonuclease 4 n=1 Tax=Calicophoron daubneyi TaxID=300641 RepID=A0AAV2THH9_CALDB
MKSVPVSDVRKRSSQMLSSDHEEHIERNGPSKKARRKPTSSKNGDLRMSIEPTAQNSPGIRKGKGVPSRKMAQSLTDRLPHRLKNTKSNAPSTSLAASSQKDTGSQKRNSTPRPFNKVEATGGATKHYSKKQKNHSSHREEIWFEGVSPALIAASKQDQPATTCTLVKPSSFAGPTRRIAIDCEFVGVGFEGKENALARVSIVNQFGHVLLDTLVRPRERVTDYRTQFSGIKPGDLRPGGPARPFNEVHKEVAKLLEGRILVGHSLGNDLKVLMLSHPRRMIRDTSRYRPFRALFGGRTPSLRALTQKVLGIEVQKGEHDSVEDARATMRLYTSVKRVWESSKKNRIPLGQCMKQLDRQVAKAQTSPAKDPTMRPTPKLDILSEYEVNVLGARIKLGFRKFSIYFILMGLCVSAVWCFIHRLVWI